MFIYTNGYNLVSDLSANFAGFTSESASLSLSLMSAALSQFFLPFLKREGFISSFIDL
uniref:Uncharacterized protein n=1 Tax=Manihot esculenta TaxID=3983 RepID=A0A2C9V910_MANES